MMLLETNRLKIRNLELTDKNTLFTIYSDKEAMKYRGSKPFEMLEEVDEMLNKTFQKFEAKEEFRYAVTLKENNELIGTFLIKQFSENECEIGYSIGKNFWRKGYAKELLYGMLKHLKNTSFTKIIATSKKENISSLKLLESVGFIQCPEKEFNNCLWFEYL